MTKDRDSTQIVLHFHVQLLEEAAKRSILFQATKNLHSEGWSAALNDLHFNTKEYNDYTNSGDWAAEASAAAGEVSNLLYSERS